MTHDSRLDIIRIDLRPLELAGVIDVANLRLGIELVRLPPALPVPVPGGLDAAEREVRLCADGGSVHVSDAVVQLLHGLKGEINAPGVDLGGRRILKKIVHPDGLLE